MRFNVAFAASAALITLLSLGCAETSWQAARRANTVAAYHQFLRNNEGSPQAAEAHERIAFLRASARPTIKSYEKFVAEHPNSVLIAELKVAVEPWYFESARTENTVAAYSEFIREYPSGQFATRARGNLVYVGEVRGNPTPAMLREFVAQHPESDFTPEAQRTLDLLESHRLTSIRNLAVRVDVAANVLDADRVRKGFAHVVARSYGDLGIPVTMVEPGDPVPPGVDAWMKVDYREVPADGSFGSNSLVSRCRVRLYQKDFEAPVWDHTFQAPAEHTRHSSGGRDPTLFGNARYDFWQQFFVPVSSWATNQARIQHIDYNEPVAALDVLGDRAAVLFASGGLEYLDVSSALRPQLLGRFRRGRSLTKWTGIQVLPGDRVVVYGTNGAELFELEGSQLNAAGAWEAADVGTIKAAALYDPTLLLAGSKGLFAVRLNRENAVAHRLLEADLVGVVVDHPYIYLVRPDRLDVAKPKQLLSHLTGLKIPFGDRFDASRSRVSGDSLYVFGDEKIVELKLVEPGRPVPVALMDTENLGRVNDVAADDGHVYLLGDRGLQVAGPRAEWVSDFIQVSGDRSMIAKGRYVLVGGGTSLEVIDMSPYRAEIAAASPARAE